MPHFAQPQTGEIYNVRHWRAVCVWGDENARREVKARQIGAQSIYFFWGSRGFVDRISDFMWNFD